MSASNIRYAFRPSARGLWPPRRTVRLRLTVVYGGLFLLTGAALLAITYFLVSRNLPSVPRTVRRLDTRLAPPAEVAGGNVFFRTGNGGCRLVAGVPPSPAQLAARAQRCLSQQRALELNQLLTESGLALGIMTGVSVGLGWLVAGRMLRKLRTITTAARSISAGNLHARLSLTGPDDELRELGDTFDGLLARLEAAFEAERQFVANASHELRTPLARQRTVLEVALADPAPSLATLRNACARALTAGAQQERLIEALLTLARSQRGLNRREPVDLAVLTQEVLLAREGAADERRLTISADLEPAPMFGDPRLAERLVVNLIDNAVRHNVANGTVLVSTGVEAGSAVISVINSGPVIRPEYVSKLLRPFQRLGADRTGTPDGLGLGLSIVAAIAEAHGGWLRLDPRSEGGLVVRAAFPQMIDQSTPTGEVVTGSGLETRPPSDRTAVRPL
jgi:signal transduction histidine kinase